MLYELKQDDKNPETWRVEAVGSDGEVYQALFIGPEAAERAREYAAYENSSEQTTLLKVAKIPYLRDNYPKLVADLEQIASEDWLDS
jgi:hypothetical protein